MSIYISVDGLGNRIKSAGLVLASSSQPRTAFPSTAFDSAIGTKEEIAMADPENSKPPRPKKGKGISAKIVKHAHRRRFQEYARTKPNGHAAVRL